MKNKIILSVLFALISTAAHAIPPIPPEAIGNEISLSHVAHCKSPLNGMLLEFLSAFKNLKFTLLYSPDPHSSTLNIIENDDVIESLTIDCQ